MERALAEYVVNALWQLPVLAAAGWLFVRWVRPSPRMQHGIWLAVLALAVMMPARGLRKTGVAQAHDTVIVTENVPVREQPVPFVPRSRDLTLNPSLSRWLVRIYLAAVVLALLRIAWAWHSAHSLVARSREACGHRTELADLSRRFKVRAPQLRESEEVSSPMVVGVAAPVVLLPENFPRFAEEEVKAALCHELAHIKRQDCLMNLVCQLAALPLAWHPVVHEVQQQIRMTREMVCDAMAAEEMKSHIGYAKCLVALANSMLGGREIAGEAQFLGLFSKNTLEERVMRLMDKTTMSMQAKVARVATGAAMMIATASLTAIFHVTPTMAEQTTVAPPPAINLVAGQTQPEAVKPAAPAPPAVNKPAHTRHPARSRKTEPQSGKTVVIPDDQELQKRMEDAQRQIARAQATMDGPEFKQRMADMQRQMEKARTVFNSPEFKHQMENAQKQAAQAILNDPEFKRKMEDAQRQMAKAAEVFNSPEFKERINQMTRKAEEDRRWFAEPSPEPAPPTR
jgi:beta-lactamase regulating signal transducer with metallopeptidase domain